MLIAKETRVNTEMRRVLTGAVSATGARKGAIVLKGGTDRLAVPAAVGFASRKSVLPFLGVGNLGELRSLATDSSGRRHPAMPSFFAGPIQERGKTSGMLILFPRGRESFSAEERAAAAAAAGTAGRCLELLNDFARLQKNYLKTILVLLGTLETKDPFSRGHSARVAEYCRKAGTALGLSPRQRATLHWAAVLHDIGKVGIVDAILQKKARLTPAEMTIVREHPVIGQRIVHDLDALREASRIIRAHHERWDGRGYPDRLAGNRIPLLARILALAESFDTVTSHTPYSIGRPVEVAARELRKRKGRMFDPGLVDPFLEAIIF